MRFLISFPIFNNSIGHMAVSRWNIDKMFSANWWKTKPEYDKLKLKLGQLDQKVQNAINKNKMRQSILQDFREEFEKIINQTKKLSSENQIIELNYKIAQFQKRYFDYFGYKSEMPSVDNVASSTAEPKPSHPYNLRPRPRSNQQTVTPEQNITKRPNSRSDCIPLNQFQSLNTSPGDVEEAREADSNAVAVPSDISFENEAPKYAKTRGWEDTPKVHNSVNTTRYQNASKNQSYRDKVVSTESQKEILKNRQPQGHGHSFTIYGTNGNRLHHASGDCKNQGRYVSEKQLEITTSKEKEFKDQKNYENNKIDTNQKTTPSSLLENEPSKYEDQETKQKQKSKLIEEKRIFFETAHGTGEVISYSSGYQPKRQFVTTTKTLYNYYPNEEKSAENEREQHRLEVEKQAEAVSRNMANQISTSSFDRKTLRGEEANKHGQTEEEKRDYGGSGKSLNYEINMDHSSCNYRITQGWTWHDKFQENSCRINQSNNYPKAVTQSERKHDDMHSSRQCSHHNREQTATQLVSSYQGYNQNQGFETSQEKAISSNQYGSLHDRNEGKTISDTQYRYTEDVEKFFQQFGQNDQKPSKSETYPEARSSANQYYDESIRNIQMKPTSQQNLPEHQCRGRGRLQIQKFLKPEDQNFGRNQNTNETSRFSQDQKIPEEKHPEQYYHSDQLPKHESVEEIAEEAKEEQMEILDVHQYFQNDFDLKTLKDKEPLEQIENVRSFAKNYEKGVRNFSGANYSLEYFVLDEKLMRLIEHLDKLKCQDDKEATKRKIAVIEYITNLHNILDQRATD